MWPRKQLDIGWSDLAFGLSQVVAARSRPAERSRRRRRLGAGDEAIRFALRAIGLGSAARRALELPAGSEVIVSAVTIPDMVRIIEHHGLVPVPVDVDAATLEPMLEQIGASDHAADAGDSGRPSVRQRASTWGRSSSWPGSTICWSSKIVRRRLSAANMRGIRIRIAALFSFGPIKTATALGGAVVRVRDAALRARMAELQRAYPVQSRLAYLKRLAQVRGVSDVVQAVRCMASRCGCCRRLGIDYDRALGNAAHSFGASDFFAQIRRQPCVPLVRMLGRRITTFERRGAAGCDGGRSAAMICRRRSLKAWSWASRIRRTRIG